MYWDYACVISINIFSCQINSNNSSSNNGVSFSHFFPLRFSRGGKFNTRSKKKCVPNERLEKLLYFVQMIQLLYINRYIVTEWLMFLARNINIFFLFVAKKESSSLCINTVFRQNEPKWNWIKPWFYIPSEI